MPEVTFLGSHGVANISLVCKNLSIPYCILILNPTRRFIFKFYYYLAAIFFYITKDTHKSIWNRMFATLEKKTTQNWCEADNTSNAACDN